MATDYTIPKDEYRALLDENAKLRELCSDMFVQIEESGFDPMVARQGKRGPYYEEDPSWRVKIRERIRELRIEVDYASERKGDSRHTGATA